MPAAGNHARWAGIAGLAVSLLAVFAGLTWANLQFAGAQPGGNDFLPRYVGTRLFLLKGISPYSPEASLAIQVRIFGRAAQSGEDFSLFVYPLYSTVVFAPFALIPDYPLARAAWMSALEAALAGLCLISLRLAGWKPPAWLGAALLLFALTWYHGFRPVINGNAAVLCALFIAGGLWAIRAQRDALAGLLLALASIKPQMVVLLLPWTLLWAVSVRRWRLAASLGGWMAGLTAAGLLVHPDWIQQNLAQVLAYPGYTEPGTPWEIGAALLPGAGVWVGYGACLAAGLLLLFEWRRAWGHSVEQFGWAALLTLALTNLSGVRTSTENYIALFPALILALAALAARFRRAGNGLTLGALLALHIGLWALFLGTLIPAPQPTQSPVMFLPFLALALAGLYTARGGIVRIEERD